MKHVKNKPPELCECMVWKEEARLYYPCGNPVKYERFFTDPKAKPMRLCGIHARQAERKGYVVKLIGE